MLSLLNNIFNHSSSCLFSPRTAHLYSATERIDGEDNIKCPECHAEAKGTAAKTQAEV